MPFVAVVPTPEKVTIPCACCRGTGQLTGWQALRPYRLYYEIGSKEVAVILRRTTSFICQVERGERKQGDPVFHQQYLDAVDRLRVVKGL